MLLTEPSRFLAWDEATYISEVSAFADPIGFDAHRARGVTFVVAPVGLLTESMTVTRVYLALVSSVGLALSFLPWIKLVRWVAPISAGIFASSWLTIFYGSEIMPNLWSAFLVLASVGLGMAHVKYADSRLRLVGLAATTAALGLTRPLDAAMTVAIFGLIWALVHRRQAFHALLVAGAGVGIGSAAWLAEAWVRFNGPIDRLERARAIVGGGVNNNIVEYLRLLDGPTSGPDGNPDIALVGVVWLLVVFALGVVGGVSSKRVWPLGPITLAGAALLSAPYLFLSEAAAPRFMFPAIALLAMAAGLGLWSLVAKASSPLRLAVVLIAGASLVLLNVGTVSAINAEQTAARGRALHLADSLSVAATSVNCFFLSTTGYPQISVSSGCRGGRYLGEESLERLDRAVEEGAQVFVLLSSVDDAETVTNHGGGCELVEGLEDRRWHLCEWNPDS
ncbi:MAG: hypothetical protein IH943_04900 [Acidobacteria bacterium]|nr:hypothetical protein [Acidobacteriota bacterium]